MAFNTLPLEVSTLSAIILVRGYTPFKVLLTDRLLLAQ